MPPDAPASIHATAVAIAGHAVLIVGPSKAGKSRLAIALIAASTRRRPIRLIGDDCIVLSWRGDSLVAGPHPRIAGFIERRGLGIVAMCHAADVPVAGAVELGGGAAAVIAPLQEAGLPLLSLAAPQADAARRDAVLEWAARSFATKAQHPAGESRRAAAEDG